MKRNAVVLQSGGMTQVINASLIGVLDAMDGIGSVYGARYGIRGLSSGDLYALTELQACDREFIKTMPSGFLGSSRLRLDEELLGRCFEASIKKYDIGVVFMIGGNDTAYNAGLLAEYASRLGMDLQVIGIPKTIDNDLPFMHFCPGYPSTARFVAVACQEAGLDTLAMKDSDPIKIVEVMGRNAGWIVAASGLLKRYPAQPPHIMCFPEQLLDIDEFVTKVERIYRSYGFAVIVVSETIRDLSGRRIGEKRGGIVADGFGHGYVESPAQRLCSILEDRLGVRARYDKPGTMQRMSIAHTSDLDLNTAYEAGRYAVDLFKKGVSGVEVVIERNGFSSVPISEIAEKERLLPEEFMNDTKDFISPAFYEYALPLLGGIPVDFSRIYELLGYTE